MDVIDYRKGCDPFETISGEVFNQTGKNLDKEKYKTTEYVNDINRANEEVLFARVSGRYDEGTYSYLYGLNRESYFVSEAITSVGAASTAKSLSLGSAAFFYTGTGSVSNLISENEDRFGISYTYDPFGNVTKSSLYEPITVPDVTYESGVRDLTNSYREYDNPYTYNAEYIHSSLGIQYLRARYYDAKAGSFISKDSYSGSITETISQNRYTYANNNPLSYCDPSGHKSKPNTSNMCTAAQQAMERAANAAAARTGSASNKNNTPKTIQGVPSDVKAILEKRNGSNSANGIDRNTLQESLDRAEQSRRWAETVEKPLLYAQKAGEWLDSAAYGLVNRLDNSFLGKGLYGFADFVDRVEKGACKAYDKLINKIQEKLPGKDVRRIIKGTGLIVEGVFKGVAGLTLAAASAVAVPIGIGILGEAAAALIVVSGGSDFTQGMQEIQLGWKGDSQTKTTNLTRDALFGGEEFDTLYHVSTDTAAIFAGFSGAAASINTSKPVTVPEGKISETVKWAEDSVDRPTPKVVSESAPVDSLSVPVAGGGSGTNNPLENIEYTDKVLRQMQQGDYHAFPDSVTAFGDMANAEQIIGGDGVIRMKYEIAGSYKGKNGVFQFIIEPDGYTCNHRVFVPSQLQ